MRKEPADAAERFRVIRSQRALLGRNSDCEHHIASTDDNRFRAFDSKSGKELWTATLERRGNADPLTYQGRNGKQYVAVVATDSVVVYTLP